MIAATVQAESFYDDAPWPEVVSARDPEPRKGGGLSRNYGK
jgi:hypothetical protein